MPFKPENKRRPWLTKDKRRERGLDLFYQGRRWRVLRNKYIQNNPLCVYCEKDGRLIKGNVVDHIVPRTQGGSDYSLDNLQTLCTSCHNSKSSGERIDRYKKY